MCCCCYRKGTNFQANHNSTSSEYVEYNVVVATAKVQIFKQITTAAWALSKLPGCCCYRKGTNFQANHNLTTIIILSSQLLLLPQRYKFSSKSQLHLAPRVVRGGCCCYRKGTNFQANHNVGRIEADKAVLLLLPQRYKFSSKSQQKTKYRIMEQSCCCYRKGTNFQANHNCNILKIPRHPVVVATAKVQIFKQITTFRNVHVYFFMLLLLPQRYKFSSKSQPSASSISKPSVVVATAKVQIFKQITTVLGVNIHRVRLLLLPQRYKFSSKSQPSQLFTGIGLRCCCYRKGTNFQANHNCLCFLDRCCPVVVATAKVQIFKQITTEDRRASASFSLLLLPQRYKFSSKSQLFALVCMPK